MIANAPSRAMRIPWNRVPYRGSILIERCSLRLEAFRHIATRYDKTAPGFPAFIALAACAVLWK